MSWANTLPSWSSATRPTNAAAPPNDATPAIVFAAEPPEISVPGPMAAYSRSAVGVSIRVIDPTTSSCSVTNSNDSCDSTSTRAFPIATTSRRLTQVSSRSSQPFSCA